MPRPLANRGFLSLVVTQFFGAANDNILKTVLTFMVIAGDGGIWDRELGAGGQGFVGVVFTVPFVVLSGYAGQFADRHSKRMVSVLVKVIEIPIAMTALIGFWTGNLWITLGALVALACQSAYFGPAKYGMIPELVDDHELSRANGIINMMTNIAVIAGVILAGTVADRYYPKTESMDPTMWLPGVVLIAIACAGLCAVLFLPRLTAGDPDLKYDRNPFATYAHAIRDMAKGPLLVVALAWGYFYLLAGMALLIIPEYTIVLAIDREQAGLLLGMLGLAIGGGSIAAGLVSGRRIEPRLVPIGAAGVTVFFVLLALVPPTLTNVRVLVIAAGFCAGFYIIPLQAMLQHLSPDDERGRFLGTANGISFTFLTIAAALYWIIRPLFGNAPQLIFLVCAALMLAGAVVFFGPFRKALMGGNRAAMQRPPRRDDSRA